MAAKSISLLRVFGLWLLYLLVGFILLLALFAGADVGSGPDKDSPTGWAAKIVGALCGLAFAAAGLGMWMVGDPNADPEAANILRTGGFAAAGVLTLLAWVLIARDLAAGVGRR